MSNFDILFANITAPDDVPQQQQQQSQQICPSTNNNNETNNNNNNNKNSQHNDTNYNIIREVLSMLNGLNAEQLKKNPNDLFMLLKYRSDIHLDDACCQMIIRIGGLGKILLKILNYLNYYNSSKENSIFAYPMFDDDVDRKTLGNIRQYFVQSIHNEIKEYHYHLLMIESKFRSLRIHYSFILRRIMLWSTQWLNKFLFIVDILKICIDFKGIALLNQIYDFSRNGDMAIQTMARSILHQSLKPFIFNMFDWLLYGEIDSEKINQDFFIKIKDKSSIELKDPFKKCDNLSDECNSETFEWKSYELNKNMLPSFMSARQMKKIFFIGNSIRLLRYMIKDEYDQKMVNELFFNSPIQVNYDIIKKFLFKNIEALNGCDRFFFEHSLVDDFDLLLESYYDVINEEMFKLLNMNKIKAEFELLFAYILIQRGDFYESLIDYLFPLLKKPASEVINIIQNNNSNCTNLHRIFNMFMINSKLIDMHQVYKIDSLLYNNFELNENLVFTFAKNHQTATLKHNYGWDCFIVRYTFSKNVYRVMFDCQLFRYERLFRNLFYYKRSLYSIRKAQHQIMHFDLLFKHKLKLTANPCSQSLLSPEKSRVIVLMLNTLHFLFFHMFGFASRMYRYFGNQIDSLWSTMFESVFEEQNQKRKNIDQFVRSHEKFLKSIENVVLFNENFDLLAAYQALNDSIIDFCETFCEEDFFPTMNQLANNLKPTLNEQPMVDHLELSRQLFKHQFKISIIISKYRCCVKKFIHLSQNCGINFQFKYDLLTYQPCLDSLFRCFDSMKHLNGKLLLIQE